MPRAGLATFAVKRAILATHPAVAGYGFRRSCNLLSARQEQWVAAKLKLATGKISEEPFKLLVQSILDYAIYLLDPNGFVTSWNAGAEHIKGFQADEIVGQHFSKFYT